jgi:hypothetical protein
LGFIYRLLAFIIERLGIDIILKENLYAFNIFVNDRHVECRSIPGYLINIDLLLLEEKGQYLRRVIEDS